MNELNGRYAWKSRRGTESGGTKGAPYSVTHQFKLILY